MYNSRSDRQPQKGEVISQSFLAATFSCSFQSLAGFFPPLSFFFFSPKDFQKEVLAQPSIKKKKKNDKK